MVDKNKFFDDTYMNLAQEVAKTSHCVKIGVGAVIVKDTRVISLGINGAPAGTHNCKDEWPTMGCAKDRKGSCFLALHSEQNAIIYGMKNGASVDGSILYVTLSPCLPCARLIYSVGIKKVIYLNSYAEYKGIIHEEGIAFLQQFGITVIKHKK